MSEPTRRQLTAIGFAALLSPATRLLPGAAARAAGHAGWLCPLAAAPLCALAALLVSRAMKFKRAGEGLGEVLLRSFPRFARALLALYGLWLALYAGFAVRSAASRFIYTIYTGAPPRLFVAVGLAAGTAAALGGIKRLARSAEIFRALLVLTLLPILALGLAQMDWSALAPVRVNAGGVLTGALEAFGTVGFALVNVPFLETGSPVERRARHMCAWSLRECLFFAAVVAAVLGRFGPELSAAMTYPFFALVRNTGLFGVAERIEALVTALWVLSDFVLCGLSLMAGARCLRLALGLTARSKRPLTLICAAAALLGALAAAPDALTLKFVSEELIVAVNLVMTGAMLATAAAAARRARGRRA